MNNIIVKEFLEKYIFAGNAWFTLTSKKTHKHFTYNIYRKKDGPLWFVKIIHDGSAYTYAGYIKKIDDTYKYFKGTSGNYGMDDKRIFALMWFLYHFYDADIDSKVVLQHVGKCCRCGRKLTDPKSIDLGIGPECIKFV